MKEIYPNYYITELGDIFSNKTGKLKPLKKFVNEKGYLFVRLYVNGKARKSFIHRLVAVAFIPNPENKPQVNHKDGDKTNNAVPNLEWNTGKENVKHAIEVLGVVNTRYGKDNHLSIPVVATNIKTGETFSFESRSLAAKTLKLLPQSIHKYFQGQMKQTGGYTFKEM